MVNPVTHGVLKTLVLIVVVTISFGFAGRSPSLANGNSLQDGQAIIRLEIEKVIWNGNPVKHDSSVIFKLEKGENLFVIYQNDKLGCLVEFNYKRGASKIHLSTRIIVETETDGRIYGKLQKETFDIQANGINTASSSINETITYDRKTMSTMQVVFEYVIE
jgi:hypothetical protein